MSKTKVTKRALIISALSLVICISMLLGTTYAWFTDSVVSAGNIIKSGTLDVEMYYADGTKAVPTAYEGEGAWTDASTGAIFNYDLWEPGYTQVRHIQIKNVGTLALKYKVQIVANGTVSDLADVIDVYYMDPAEQIADRTDLAAKTPMGTLTAALAGMAATASGRLAAGKADTVTIALKMQESAGNEYQNKSIGTDFSIQLLATQDTVENDSFDNQYDANAELNFVPVASVEGLTAALENGGNISVDENIDTSARFNVTKDTTINGNGQTIAVNTGDNRVLDLSDTTGVTLNLNDVVLDASNAKVDSAYVRGVSLYGNEDVTLNVKGSTIKSIYYAINVAGANNGVNINLANASVAAGWAALNIWSKSEVNVKDSYLSGTNDKTYNSVGWNNFATVVMNYQDANTRTKDSVLNFENTVIEGSSTTGNRQVLVDFRDDYITANFTNCTFVSNGTPNGFDDFMFLFCEHETVTFTNCKFIKDGAEVNVADYISFYDHNDPATSTITVDGTVLTFS